MLGCRVWFRNMGFGFRMHNSGFGGLECSGLLSGV